MDRTRGHVWSPVGQHMNTVEELKTDGAGSRVTAGDGGYCNFRNQAQLYSNDYEQ